MEELRPHQKVALTKLSDGKILWGAVGSGKSRVAVAYYEQEARHEDVYVITTAKKRDSKDWETEFARIVVGKHADSTLHGILTVDSWNNLSKYVDVEEAFFIFDEQRLVGSGTWVKSFLKIARNNKWIMLTATPGDTWLDYIPVFIANGFYKNRTEFKRDHVVYSSYTKFPKVERYLATDSLVRLRNELLVHMPYPKVTVRHSITCQVDQNEELLHHVMKNRWHIFHDRPIRDISELFAVMRRIVNSDPSRLRTVRKLLKQHDKIVLFYNFDYELGILRTLAGEVEIAEWNGHKHEDIPKSDKWLYLVQYVAGSESWNCIETNVIVFYSLTYSYKLWEQAHGRIDRMDTPFIDLFYYILRGKNIIDLGVWQSLKSKQNFNIHKIPANQLKTG